MSAAVAPRDAPSTTVQLPATSTVDDGIRPGPRPARASEPSRPRIRVLVVDDSRDHRELMARRLRSAGMQVTPVGSAAQAVEGCDGVDLVVLDLRLPGTDGLEVLNAIRARSHPPSVVMVTAAGSTEVAVEAMRAGAAHFLAKEDGYLDALPEVVARAWRHHDLERRATELQRAALALAARTDVGALAHEIAHAARRLADASSVRLWLTDVEPVEPVEPDGSAGSAGTVEAPVGPLVVELGSPPDHPMLAGDAIRHEYDTWVDPTGCVVVRLPGDEQAAGQLHLWPRHPPTEEEHQLLRAFAAFAGTALAGVRRLEVERRLVRELERSLDARQDFIASISHELRTPLTAISGFSYTLRTHLDALGPDRVADLLARVHRNAEELGRLVDELLELAAWERGGGAQPVWSPIDLGVSVREVLEGLAPVLAGHEVEVALQATEVAGDVVLVRRTLTNLLSNAAKFSPTGAPVRLTSQRDADGERVRVAVTDRGVGLHEWEARHVFEAFYRTSSSVSDAVRGSGIGLALVARYVASMGGQVGVDSTAGEGSTFWFTLPRPSAVPAGPPPHV